MIHRDVNLHFASVSQRFTLFRAVVFSIQAHHDTH